MDVDIKAEIKWEQSLQIKREGDLVVFTIEQVATSFELNVENIEGSFSGSSGNSSAGGLTNKRKAKGTNEPITKAKKRQMNQNEDSTTESATVDPMANGKSQANPIVDELETLGPNATMNERKRQITRLSDGALIQHTYQIALKIIGQRLLPVDARQKYCFGVLFNEIAQRRNKIVGRPTRSAESEIKNGSEAVQGSDSARFGESVMGYDLNALNAIYVSLRDIMRYYELQEKAKSNASLENNYPDCYKTLRKKIEQLNDIKPKPHNQAIVGDLKALFNGILMDLDENKFPNKVPKGDERNAVEPPNSENHGNPETNLNEDEFKALLEPTATKKEMRVRTEQIYRLSNKDFIEYGYRIAPMLMG